MPGASLGEDYKGIVVKVKLEGGPHKKRRRSGAGEPPTVKRRKDGGKTHEEQDTEVLPRSPVQGPDARFQEVKDEQLLAVDGHGNPGFNTDGLQLGHGGPLELVLLDTAEDLNGRKEVEAHGKHDVKTRKTKKKGEWKRKSRRKIRGDSDDFGEADGADITWAKSLSGPQLDLVVSVKNLAMERVKSTKQTQLNNLLTPTALRTIGIILEEFMMDRVQTSSGLHDLSPLPVVLDENGLGQSSKSRSYFEDAKEKTDHMETVPLMLDTGDFENKESSTDEDLRSHSSHKGDEGRRMQEQIILGVSQSSEEAQGNSGLLKSSLEVPQFTEQRSHEKEISREARKERNRKGKAKLAHATL